MKYYKYVNDCFEEGLDYCDIAGKLVREFEMEFIDALDIVYKVWSDRKSEELKRTK